MWVNVIIIIVVVINFEFPQEPPRPAACRAILFQLLWSIGHVLNEFVSCIPGLDPVNSLMSSIWAFPEGLFPPLFSRLQCSFVDVIRVKIILYLRRTTIVVNDLDFCLVVFGCLTNADDAAQMTALSWLALISVEIFPAA